MNICTNEPKKCSLDQLFDRQIGKIGHFAIGLGISPAINPPPKNMYYTVWKSAANGNWYWNLKAANHETIATSEGYTTKQNALNSIALVKSSSNATVYEA